MKEIARFVYDGATVQAVAQNGAVLLPSVIKDTNAVYYDGNGGIVFTVPGTYRISASITATAAAAGNARIRMQADGLDVAGAFSAATAAAVNDYMPLNIETVKTVKPSISGFATIVFRCLDAMNVATASVVVESE